jgi:hypothetical protein
MSRNFDEIVPDEVLKQRSRFEPLEVPAPARPVWDWEELNAKFRPRLIAAGVIRFGLSQDDCEGAAQTVFLKVLAMNPRVRDPKAYLRAAFLNQCNNIVQARQMRTLEASNPAIVMRELRLAESGEIEIRIGTEPISERTGPIPPVRLTLWDRIRGALARLRP